MKEELVSGIYEIINHNNEIYIGKSTDIEKRYKEGHLRGGTSAKIKKGHEGECSIKLLEEISSGNSFELRIREQYWIDNYRFNGKPLNNVHYNRDISSIHWLDCDQCTQYKNCDFSSAYRNCCMKIEDDYYLIPIKLSCKYHSEMTIAKQKYRQQEIERLRNNIRNEIYKEIGLNGDWIVRRGDYALTEDKRDYAVKKGDPICTFRCKNSSCQGNIIYKYTFKEQKICCHHCGTAYTISIDKEENVSIITSL